MIKYLAIDWMRKKLNKNMNVKRRNCNKYT